MSSVVNCCLHDPWPRLILRSVGTNIQLLVLHMREHVIFTFFCKIYENQRGLS